MRWITFMAASTSRRAPLFSHHFSRPDGSRPTQKAKSASNNLARIGFVCSHGAPVAAASEPWRALFICKGMPTTPRADALQRRAAGSLIENR
jgi:hypothetical protein